MGLAEMNMFLQERLLCGKVDLMKDFPFAVHTKATCNSEQDLVHNLLSAFGNEADSKSTFCFDTTKGKNATDGLNNHSCTVAFSKMLLNNISEINKYLKEQNEQLDENDFLVCFFQSSSQRKEGIFKNNSRSMARFIYAVDYIWHRIFAKIPFLKNIYYQITQGKEQVLPYSEVYGRFFYCGFKVVAEQSCAQYHSVIVKKTGEPEVARPSYGMFIKLPRVVRNEKIANVYKLRTMHAYSEYLQEYIYEQNELKEGGKFANDYRISGLGRLLRKYWIDEFPMILNLLKGDIKLVGVRPLSQQYFNLYEVEIQKLRIKVKPGLLPPFYADMPKTLEDIQRSEKQYIESYLKNPYLTDLKYLKRILYNIIFNRRRSQ